uniref:Transmembrane protein n=1 Tax=Oryza glumipatula TaxID=40148 RepID=A0A0E0BLY2_9ORYZ
MAESPIATTDMAESPVATTDMAEFPVATTDDHSAAEIQHSESDLGEKESLVDPDRSGDGRQAAAAGEEHTSDLLLLLLRRRLHAELRKLREVVKAELDRDARLARLILLSLLLALAMPILLWFSAGEPLLLVWRLSLLLSAYFFLCAALLFVTKGLLAVVVDFSYGALLAYFADHVFSPRVGMVVIFLNSISTAGLAGYALAERRQSDGAERSTDEIPTLSHDKEEYADCCRITLAMLSFLVLVAPTVFIAWELLWHIADYPVDEIVGDLSIVVMLYVLCFTLLITQQLLLRGALIGVENHMYTIITVFLVVAALPLFFSIVIGDVAAMVVFWIGILALTVFFGYRLRLYSSYQQHKVVMMRPDDKLDDQKQELTKGKDTSADDDHEPADASSSFSPRPSAPSPPAAGSPPTFTRSSLSY